MPNNYFQFKHFTIEQGGAAMKVGTDGVLLGAWADVGNAVNILDVGTGTGLIAIMLAQRSRAFIDAVEIDEKAYHQAVDNVNNCFWKERITLYHASFQEFSKRADKKYDLIVTNPPYFVNCLSATTNSRALARHDNMLSRDDLLENTRNLLHEKSRFSLILPVSERDRVARKAACLGLFPVKTTFVHPVVDKPPKRVMMTFSGEATGGQETSLAVEKQQRHDYTDEYMRLTKDFYLAF